MTTLRWNIEQVAGLAQHARQSERHFMTFEERLEVYGEAKCMNCQPGEDKVARPKLVLVKDRGIYLMSSGEPEGEGEKRKVAYAVGFDPDQRDPGELHDDCRFAVGGDDFSAEIPLEWADEAIQRRSPEFRIKVKSDEFALMLPPVKRATA